MKLDTAKWLRIRFLQLAVVTFAITVASASLPAETLVSPPGFEQTEGNIMFLPVDSPYPTPGPMGTPDGWRAQEAHPASAFASLGNGPLLITQLAWRPDISVNEPISPVWDLTLNLSTTDKPIDSLSSTFTDNYGSDGFTEVFSGDVQLATDGIPKAVGQPHDFDYVVEFKRPFEYDPQEGNLLVEWISTTDFVADDAWVWVDADDTVGSFVFDPSAGATEARFGGPGLFITEFTIIPEPPAALSLIVGLITMAVCRAAWHGTDPCWQGCSRGSFSGKAAFG